MTERFPRVGSARGLMGSRLGGAGRRQVVLVPETVSPGVADMQAARPQATGTFWENQARAWASEEAQWAQDCIRATPAMRTAMWSKQVRCAVRISVRTGAHPHAYTRPCFGGASKQ